MSGLINLLGLHQLDDVFVEDCGLINLLVSRDLAILDDLEVLDSIGQLIDDLFRFIKLLVLCPTQHPRVLLQLLSEGLLSPYGPVILGNLYLDLVDSPVLALNAHFTLLRGSSLSWHSDPFKRGRCPFAVAS